VGQILTELGGVNPGGCRKLFAGTPIRCPRRRGAYSARRYRAEAARSSASGIPCHAVIWPGGAGHTPCSWGSARRDKVLRAAPRSRVLTDTLRLGRTFAQSQQQRRCPDEPARTPRYRPCSGARPAPPRRGRGAGGLRPPRQKSCCTPSISVTRDHLAEIPQILLRAGDVPLGPWHPELGGHPGDDGASLIAEVAAWPGEQRDRARPGHR